MDAQPMKCSGMLTRAKSRLLVEELNSNNLHDDQVEEETSASEITVINTEDLLIDACFSDDSDLPSNSNKENKSGKVDDFVQELRGLFNKVIDAVNKQGEQFSEVESKINNKLDSFSQDISKELSIKIAELRTKIDNQETTFNTKIGELNSKLDQINQQNTSEIIKINNEIQGIDKKIKDVVRKEVEQICDTDQQQTSLMEFRNEIEEKLNSIVNRSETTRNEIINKYKDMEKQIQTNQAVEIHNSEITCLSPPISSLLNNNSFSDFNSSIPHVFIRNLELEYQSYKNKAIWRYLIDSRLKGKAFLWWTIEKNRINNFEEFLSAFKLKFCGDRFTQYALNKIKVGSYTSNEKCSIVEYITNLIELANAANVFTDTRDFIRNIANHFHYRIRETVSLRDYSSIEEFLQYIENIENKNFLFKEVKHHKYNNDGNRYKPREENSNDQNKNNPYTETNNSSNYRGRNFHYDKQGLRPNDTSARRGGYKVQSIHRGNAQNVTNTQQDQPTVSKASINQGNYNRQSSSQEANIIVHNCGD